MLVNNTHISEALGTTWDKIENLTATVCKYVKVVKKVPTNNKLIKYAQVIHFDLDEAIEVFSTIKPTKARLRILEQLREVKVKLSQV
jgi:hypothetical protein